MDEWLKSKLIEMDLDESVYLPFIMTILEDDSMDNEAKSAEIKDYIGDQPNIEDFVTSVLDQWRSVKASKKNNTNAAKKAVKSLEETLNELKILTPEDKIEKKENNLSQAEKRAILSQYSLVHDGLSDEEDGEASDEEDPAHFRLDNLPEDPFADVNPNRAAAKLEEQVKREQMKQDHVKKVEEKKLAREKFKAEKARKEEERKKAATKQERRR
eukprot:TRINITY_DN10392_c0_g1_i1.p1 TRINITY_DN10392_c0_g1~~TRINITY_DN10392_c0_g1_i1.p1  ORF type:complete len:214 (+),score=103.53 TRINITY_DN10392_c0_g1_i1:309-950(+)